MEYPGKHDRLWAVLFNAHVTRVKEPAQSAAKGSGLPASREMALVGVHRLAMTGQVESD